MRAITCDASGSAAKGTPEVMRVSDDVPVPQISSKEHVLMRVEATAVNRADILQVKVAYDNLQL